VPLTSWIALCVILGHAAGAAGSPSLALVCAVACATVCRLRLRRDPRVIAACALLSLSGGARATADRWERAHCRDRIARSTSVEFVTDFDLAAGEAASGIARIDEDQCTSRAMVRAKVAIAGGRWYRSHSHAEPTPRGVSIIAAKVTPLAARDVRASLRAAGVRRVDSVFTRDAAIARALLLADMHLIAPDFRQRWARSGLVHLLSVSGVHVAIVAAALLMLGQAMRLSQRTATLAALGMTTIYVAILGLPPPAVRAAVMFGGALIGKLRQRPSSAWSILILGALLPVCVDSSAPIDLGWQLSVLGVVALASSGALSRRLGWHGGGWKQKLRRELLSGTIASTSSVPLIAWYFGTISLIAPVANLFAAPLVAVLQPTLFLALVCAPILPLARFIADAAHPVLAMLDGVAHVASRPAWVALSVAPTLMQCVLGGGMTAALLWAMVARRVARPLMFASAGGALLVWHDLLPGRGNGALELHMLDVGQGDALALRTPAGSWIVIDAGGGAPGIDHGRRSVLPYIRARGGRVGGAPALIGATHPARYVDAAFAGGTEAYRASLESAAVHRTTWLRVHPGDTLRVDGVLLRFLAPDSTWTASLQDANLASTILRVEYGAVSMLFVGDAEEPEEEWLLAHSPPDWLRADILKVGHHGSRTSSSPAFLDAVQPRLALISVGRGNRYGHPSPSVLDEFDRREVPILRTDRAGTTVVRTDGYEIVVTTAAHEWTLPPPRALLTDRGHVSSAP
jgi:competence protein ComEC